MVNEEAAFEEVGCKREGANVGFPQGGPVTEALKLQ